MSINNSYHNDTCEIFFSSRRVTRDKFIFKYSKCKCEKKKNIYINNFVFGLSHTSTTTSMKAHCSENVQDVRLTTRKITKKNRSR